MSDKLISIIVPVYNVEKYIKKCLESLTMQTYKNIEILIVDDGTKDDSIKIAKEFEKNDNRIKILSKLNGGLSDARNFGLNIACGEYVFFVDSDDWLELNACEMLIKDMESLKVDIVIGRTKVHKNEKIYYLDYNLNDHIKYGFKINGLDFLKEQLKENQMHMVVWNKLYKREFIIKHNLYFEKSLLHEDEDWTPRVFMKNPKIVISDTVVYNYLIRENSITQSSDRKKNGLDLIRTCNRLLTEAENIVDLELRELLYNRLAEVYLSAYVMGKLYLQNENSIIDKNFIRRNAKSRKNKFKAYIFCMNPKLYCSLLTYYRNLKKGA